MEANLLAAASLALLFAKILILNRLPSYFEGAYELGLLMEAVLCSIVASYAFFVFVLHFRQVADRRKVLPYVAKHVGRVVGDCQLQLNDVGRATGRRLELESLTLDDINDAFVSLGPYKEAPLTFVPGNSNANWLQYLEHFVEKTQRTIGRVLVQLPYLDAELVRLITLVDDCDHFEHMHLMGSTFPVGNTNLEAWGSSFFEYCERCKTLSRYPA